MKKYCLGAPLGSPSSTRSSSMGRKPLNGAAVALSIVAWMVHMRFSLRAQRATIIAVQPAPVGYTIARRITTAGVPLLSPAMAASRGH
eukprot:CAMPEP_0182944450 /NCGR_PEP_ID=MMETSP0105_2-20130417/53943_1 /TAXON_ID=81532 ORGANISM="Acanthoeca-like sp., Strain 10tr" /NCGR_SAMPLE_ID=MMETSP0105_2 /ASSEMBLY_ACC=CAM_ASM_000205 /LENGTH=87 /DNA_ID=CAMNT_0025084379 /DNA_START=268 /DNA_END=531 /DNA_ORIENTATION=+